MDSWNSQIFIPVTGEDISLFIIKMTFFFSPSHDFLCECTGGKTGKLKQAIAKKQQQQQQQPVYEHSGALISFVKLCQLSKYIDL